jgi:hypothetical protein
MMCRSAMNSANPTRIRITPIADVVTIGKALCGWKIGMLVRAASSVRYDCTAPHQESFMQGRCSRSSHRAPETVSWDHSKPP